MYFRTFPTPGTVHHLRLSLILFLIMFIICTSVYFNSSPIFSCISYPGSKFNHVYFRVFPLLVKFITCISVYYYACYCPSSVSLFISTSGHVHCLYLRVCIFTPGHGHLLISLHILFNLDHVRLLYPNVVYIISWACPPYL